MGSLTFTPSKMGAPSFHVSLPFHSSPSYSPSRLPFKVYCRVSEAQTTTKKLPPGPMKLPLIGNLYNLVGSLPHHALRDLAKEYGPLMHLQLGEISAAVVSSPGMAEEVMKTHDLVFAQRPELLASKIVTYGGKDIAFAPNNDYWRQMKRLSLTELLGPKRVQQFSSIREEEISKLIESFRLSAGTPINFTEKIFYLTSIVTCRAAFGDKCKDQDAVIALTKEATEVGGGFNVVDLFPSLEFLQLISGMKVRLEKCRGELDRIFDAIIQQKTESKKSSGESEEEDLLDVLLRLQGSGSFKCPVTNNHLKAVILDLFVAGTDTSSTTVDWAMSEMMKNPRVFKKAQAEVRQAFKGKKTITETDIQPLKYLKSVIKEALRLHPPAPLLLPRESKQNVEIDGYEIPVKTKVIVNAWAIGRDREAWHDAESFMPERFDDSSVDFKGMDFEFIPFGAGRRICPGISFGMANIELPLAKLLYHFDWKLPDGITPETLDMTEAFGATVGRKNNLYLIATPYKPSHDDSSQRMEAMNVLN